MTSYAYGFNAVDGPSLGAFQAEAVFAELAKRVNASVVSQVSTLSLVMSASNRSYG